MPKRVGVLFGMERSFPPALVEEINRKGAGKVVGESLKTGPVRQDVPLPYDVVLDRISHEVPFYRTILKAAAASGVQVVNNPFWASSDDKFLDNVIAATVGVAVPRTVLLPHKEHPPNTGSDSFGNLEYPVDWDAVFGHLGFPLYLKPAYGGGWKDVYKVGDPESFFRAYDQTHSLTMMAQEAIDFTEYYRCYCVGRERVRVMLYDPRAPFEKRYVRDREPSDRALVERIEGDCRKLCAALGYDLDTLEFAVRGGVPYAIDFMNPAPDCDLFSVGQANFDWVLDAVADLLVDRALDPRPLEVAGAWVAPAKRPAEV